MEKMGVKSWIVSKKARIIALVVAGFVVGYMVRGPGAEVKEKTRHAHIQEAQGGLQEQRWWTCSMHPQIRQPKPGKCPICFMDLVPVITEAGEIGERQISFSQEAIKLMDYQESPPKLSAKQSRKKCYQQ